MTKATIKKVNAALPPGYELVKGNGYFYFWGGDCPKWQTSSVYVNNLSAFTVEEWVKEFDWLKKENE